MVKLDLDLDYNDSKVINILKKSNIDIEQFKQYTAYLNNILKALIENYGGNMLAQLFIKDDNVCIKFYWDYDIFKNSAEYRCGDWSKEDVLYDFIRNILHYIYSPIATKVNINIIEK